MSAENHPKSIVFDLDGTLIDSTPDIAAALNRVMQELNQNPLSVEYVEPFIGDGSKSMLRRIFQENHIDSSDTFVESQLVKYIQYYQEEPVSKTKFYPFVKEDLNYFHAAKIKLGICTNKPHALTKLVVNSLGIAHLFDAILGADAVKNRKPHPDHLRDVIGAMGKTPEHILYVGDAEIDRTCAHAAGVPFFLVRWGTSDKIPTEDDVSISRLLDLLPHTRHGETRPNELAP